MVNNRHLKKRPMIFTTNKPLSEWGKVLHDEDMAAAILDRVLERGRFIHLDGPSGRTRHLHLEESLPANTKRLRISGIGGSEFPEPTGFIVGFKDPANLRTKAEQNQGSPAMKWSVLELVRVGFSNRLRSTLWLDLSRLKWD
jgi:IstB-like ATP binding protein